MIVDAFQFFNELDCLDIRLHELSPAVERFVLVEATRTHSNQPKPLFYEENKERFREFWPKIRHVVVHDMPDDPDPWVRERFQRECIRRGLDGVAPNDIVMVSDADEIPSLDVLRRYHEKPDRMVVGHLLYVYYLTYICGGVIEGQWRPVIWAGTRIAPKMYYDAGLPLRFDGPLTPGGWHFSYLGGVERVREKLAAYAHHQETEKYHSDQGLVADLMAGLKIVNNDETVIKVKGLDGLPHYVLSEFRKFRRLIEP